jgi:hypothetical protein
MQRFKLVQVDCLGHTEGLGFIVSGFWAFGLRASGFGLRVSGFGLRISGSGFGFRVSCLRFRVSSFGQWSAPGVVEAEVCEGCAAARPAHALVLTPLPLSTVTLIARCLVIQTYVT